MLLSVERLEGGVEALLEISANMVFFVNGKKRVDESKRKLKNTQKTFRTKQNCVHLENENNSLFDSCSFEVLPNTITKKIINLTLHFKDIFYKSLPTSFMPVLSRIIIQFFEN